MAKRRSFGQKREETNKQLFVGRKDQLEKFEKNLKLGADHEDFINIFNTHGQGGVGKSYLTNRFLKLTKSAGYLTAFVDTEDLDFFEVTATMNAIAEEFKKQGYTFNKFSKKYKDYLQEKGKLEADPEKPKGTLGKIVKGGIKAGAKLGADMIPGGNTVSDFLPIDTFAEITGDWADFVAKKITNKDEVELILNPVKVLTPLWLEDLYEIADKKNFALFFDTYEVANPLLDRWLIQFLNQKFGDIPDNILLIIAGRDPVDIEKWVEFNEFIFKIPLEHFTEEEAKDFLAKRGITSVASIENILSISGRLPVYLSLLSEGDPNSPDDISDPNEKVVERFLKHIKDPIRRQLALNASLPQKLNKDIVECLLPERQKEKANDFFDWLKARPFVQKRGGHWAYHPVVRELMMRYLKESSESDWETIQGRIASFYEARMNTFHLEEKIHKFSNEQWLLYKIEYTYHNLSKNYVNHIKEAIQDTSFTFLNLGVYEAYKWAVVINQIEKTSKLENWGKILIEGFAKLSVEDSVDSYFVVLLQKFIEDEFIKAPEELSFYHCLLGYIWETEENFELAIPSYQKAIELNPKNIDALRNYGLCLDKSGNLQNAISHFELATEVDKKFHKELGMTLLRQGAYNKAINSLNIVVGFAPDDVNSHALIAISLSKLEKWEESILQMRKTLNIKHQRFYYYGLYWSLFLFFNKLKKIDLFKKYDEPDSDIKKRTLLIFLGFLNLNSNDTESAFERFKDSLNLWEEKDFFVCLEEFKSIFNNILNIDTSVYDEILEKLKSLSSNT